MSPASQEKFNRYSNAIKDAQDIPAYKLLRRIILMAIENGDWKIGDAIPAETVFAQWTGVSVGTVKKAILCLVTEGVLYRRQGSGTYVSSESFSRQLRRHYRFVDNFNNAESENSVLLHSLKVIPPHPEINKLLGLPNNGKLIEVLRIFKELDKVVVLSYSYVCEKTFSTLTTIEKQRFQTLPLYVIFEEDYQVKTIYGDELISIDTCSQSEASLLNISEQEPVLKLRLRNFSESATPYEYRESFCKLGTKSVYRHIKY